MRLQKNLKLVAAFIIFAFPLCSNAASRAKYAGEFIAIGVGGRALGLGGAYTALANDVTAGYWNPAGLSNLTYPQITLMHDERFGGLVNYDYGAGAMPLGVNASLAFSAIRLGIDDIANTSDAWNDLNNNGIPESDEIDYSKITYYNAADWAFYVSYAKKSGDKLSYGANIKLIRRDQGAGSATGIGFDVAAQYRVSERFLLGMNLQDATTTLVAWNTGTNELISPTLKVGSACFLDALDGRFAPALDVDVRFENRRTESNAHLGAISFDFHTGLEFNFKQLLAVRAGYSDIGTLNLGTGIHLPKLDIDYSFARFNGVEQLGNTHRISLTFTLEAEQFVRSGD
ncbi:MAG TPA: PorV/PorQ family protein [Bacteroidota bacterium]|nr:PorV/PorQ family protein [Bacteroidota bacterium]